jgi:hypothetical protein
MLKGLTSIRNSIDTIPMRQSLYQEPLMIRLKAGNQDENNKAQKTTAEMIE